MVLYSLYLLSTTDKQGLIAVHRYETQCDAKQAEKIYLYLHEVCCRCLRLKQHERRKPEYIVGALAAIVTA